MKAGDFKPCALCGKGMMHAGVPLFYRVTIERHGVILRNIQRQDGLAQFMGSPMLAQAMGDDREMTQPMMEPITVTICEACSTLPVLVAMLAEHEPAKEKA